jgi:hypothetical protein
MSKTLFTDEEQVQLKNALSVQIACNTNVISEYAKNAVDSTEWRSLSNMCVDQSELVHLTSKDLNYNLGVVPSELLKEAVEFYVENLDISLVDSEDMALNQLFTTYVALGKLEAFIHLKQ